MMKLLLSASLCLACITMHGQNGKLVNETITVDGLQREYIIYLPATYSATSTFPAVLAFHGGGGTAENSISLYNFNPVADREKFIVVYPNGIEKSWNDGRVAPKKPNNTDDVKFISMLIDRITERYHVDRQRVFSTGLSNGAIFSIYLAYKLPDKIKAIASVCGSMAVDIEKEFNFPHPISAMFINGTADKLVRYEGGPVFSENAGRGQVIPVERLLQLWITFNKCAGASQVQAMDNIYRADGCTAQMSIINSCDNATEVVSIKVTGGGHTWPGGKQYLPRLMVGNVCRDFQAEEVIWDFFKRQK